MWHTLQGHLRLVVPSNNLNVRLQPRLPLRRKFNLISVQGEFRVVVPLQHLPDPVLLATLVQLPVKQRVVS